MFEGVPHCLDELCDVAAGCLKDMQDGCVGGMILDRCPELVEGLGDLVGVRGFFVLFLFLSALLRVGAAFSLPILVDLSTCNWEDFLGGDRAAVVSKGADRVEEMLERSRQPPTLVQLVKP